MNLHSRRRFLKFCSAVGAAVATGASVFQLEGCSFNVADAINTVLNSALAILKVAEPNATWTASLASAIAALQQAETNWQAGGVAAIVIDALNTVEAVVAVTPITASYAPLIDILVAGIEAVMRAFGLTKQLPPMAMSKRGVIVNSSHYGRATISTSFAHPTWQGAYRHQWNAEAAALKLPQAQIK